MPYPGFKDGVVARAGLGVLNIFAMKVDSD
jgi:hypothetical protein